MEDSLILLLIIKKEIQIRSFIAWLKITEDKTFLNYTRNNNIFWFSKETLTEFEYKNFLMFLRRKGIIEYEC